MARFQLAIIAAAALMSLQMYVEAGLPNSCSATTNQACNYGECSGKRCYCSPIQMLFGACAAMDGNDRCFTSTHPSCGGCVTGSNGQGLCEHDKFNVPFNYAPDRDCDTWASAGDCTHEFFASYMNQCCVKSCYQPSNVGSINYAEDRCEGFTASTGTLTRSFFAGENFDQSGCISKCIDEKYDIFTHTEDIVGASFESGKCWCAYGGATVSGNSASTYCKFRLPAGC